VDYEVNEHKMAEVLIDPYPTNAPLPEPLLTGYQGFLAMARVHLQRNDQ
jgi:hypothetical protein